jgi:hypothetical protein
MSLSWYHCSKAYLEMAFTEQCMSCLQHQETWHLLSLSLSLSHTHRGREREGILNSGMGTADFGLALINLKVPNSFAIISLLVLQSAISQLNRWQLLMQTGFPVMLLKKWGCFRNTNFHDMLRSHLMLTAAVIATITLKNYILIIFQTEQ